LDASCTEAGSPGDEPLPLLIDSTLTVDSILGYVTDPHVL